MWGVAKNVQRFRIISFYFTNAFVGNGEFPVVRTLGLIPGQDNKSIEFFYYEILNSRVCKFTLVPRRAR